MLNEKQRISAFTEDITDGYGCLIQKYEAYGETEYQVAAVHREHRSDFYDMLELGTRVWAAWYGVDHA